MVDEGVGVEATGEERLEDETNSEA